MTDGIHLQGSVAFLPEMERRIGSLYAALDAHLVTEQFETARRRCQLPEVAIFFRQQNP